MGSTVRQWSLELINQLLLFLVPPAGLKATGLYLLPALGLALPWWLRNMALYGGLDFLGLGRHEWGSIHLIVGIMFLALLLLHIILHWGVIVGMYRGLIGKRGVPIAVAVVFAIVTVAMFSSALFVRPEVREGGGGHGRGGQAGSPRNHSSGVR